MGPPLTTGRKRIGHTYKYCVIAFVESVLLASATRCTWSRSAFHGVVPPTRQRFGALGGQPGLSIPNCLAYSAVNRCPPPNSSDEADKRSVASTVVSKDGISGAACAPAHVRMNRHDCNAVLLLAARRVIRPA